MAHTAPEGDDIYAWGATPLRDLAAVEEHLRCTICTQVFRTPMALDCGHCFCSICIRQWKSTGKETCPRCQKPARDPRLCLDLDALAATYRRVRPALMTVARGGGGGGSGGSGGGGGGSSSSSSSGGGGGGGGGGGKESAAQRT